MILLEIDRLMASRDFTRLGDLGHLPDISNMRLDAVEGCVEVRCKICGERFLFEDEAGVEFDLRPGWHLREHDTGSAIVSCATERIGADRRSL